MGSLVVGLAVGAFVVIVGVLVGVTVGEDVSGLNGIHSETLLSSS